MEKSNSQAVLVNKCRSISPAACQETVRRFSGYLLKKTDKIETLRREKMIYEIKSLQDRPNISENSKKIFKNYIPIHKRLDEIVRSRYEMKKQLQMKEQIKKKSEFEANCTFRPSSKSPTRTILEIVEENETWDFKRNQKVSKLKQKLEEDQDLGLTLKPSLSNKSLNLTTKRSMTPVFQRLYELKEDTHGQLPDFHPSISPLSIRLVGTREGQVFNRLYPKKLNIKLN